MVIIARREVAIALWIAICAPTPQAVAGESTYDAAQIARCIKVASRGATWLERTLWGLRDQEGGWIGAEVPNANGSHDLGPLQINSWWVPRIAKLTGQSERQTRHWLKHDPCFNAEAARWIFLSGLATTNDFWKAVGIYHSPTAWRQRRYSLGVAGHLRARFGRDVFGTAQVK